MNQETCSKYSIDTIPIKLFYKIIDSGDTSVLNCENHAQVFQDIYNEYKKLDDSGQASRLFEITTKISVLELKQKIVYFSLEALKFNKDPEIIEALKNFGFKFNEDDYFNEIERIEKQSKSIDVQIATLKEQIPKQTEKINIDELILSYCMASGLNYDTNTITITQFLALKTLVNEKQRNGK
jgi:hypothetical protein